MQASRYRTGDRLLRIFSDSAAVHVYLRQAFGRMRFDAVTEAPAPTDTGRIGWDGTSAVITFEGKPLGVRRALRDPLEAAVLGAESLFGMAFRRMGAQRALRAAGLACGRHAFAVLAPSGAGKTTLVLEMLRHGWRTYGDEYLLLDRDMLTARAFPLALAIRESSLRLVDDPRIVRACAGKPATTGPDGVRTFHGIDIVETFGPQALAEPRRLSHLVLFAHNPAAAPRLERIAPAEAARRAVAHFCIDDSEPSDVWEAVDAVSNLACYRLQAPDSRTAVSMLETLAAI